MNNTRIYAGTIGDKTRLVRASHPSQVISHIAKDTIKVEVASQEQLVALVASGVQVEQPAAKQGES
jgi:hypothetical protein